MFAQLAVALCVLLIGITANRGGSGDSHRRNFYNDAICPEQSCRCSPRPFLPSDNRTTYTVYNLTVGYLHTWDKTGCPGGQISNAGGKIMANALRYAVEELNNDTTLLPEVHFQWMHNETCTSLEATKTGVDMWLEGVNVFIGPAAECKSVAQFSASRGLPIISYQCSDSEMSNKNVYPTFARTVPGAHQITRSLFALMEHFNWRKFTCVYVPKSDYNAILQSIKKQVSMHNEHARWTGERPFQLTNITELSDVRMNIPSSARRVRRAVELTYENTRVYVLFGERKLLRAWLVVMGQMGLLDKGEYVLIGLFNDYEFNGPIPAMSDETVRDTGATYLQYNFISDDVAKWARAALIIANSPIQYVPNHKTEHFWEKLNVYVTQPPFEQHLFGNYKVPKNRPTCYLYDAMRLYALALNDTVAQKRAKRRSLDAVAAAISDGPALIKNVFSRQYESIQGFQMRIDDHGDALGNFSLFSMQPCEPGDFAGVWYNRSLAMNVAAVFAEPFATDNNTGRYKRHGLSERMASPVLLYQQNVSGILWLSGTPPLDEPKCGFQNERCVRKRSYYAEISLGIAGAVCAFLIIGATFTYRQRKFEQELAGLIWQIDPRDVQCHPLTVCSMDSVLSGSKASILIASQQMQPAKRSMKKMSVIYGPNRELNLSLKADCVLPMDIPEREESQDQVEYCDEVSVRERTDTESSTNTSPTLPDNASTGALQSSISTTASSQGIRGLALYRGSLVAIKEMKYAKKAKDISRECKIQMKQMRELHHDNVNVFLGIIVQTSSISVVREFCAKGSLFDVLRNEDIRIDQLFIASFVEDLLKGMIYLHESALKFHGNLKSTNCLVTSRWSLQVSDYGLQELRSTKLWENDEYYFDSLLWTAPELLRQRESHGTQKGDVFAFGIVLHEMLTRLGPYEILDPNSNLTSQQIVEGVMYDYGFFRPKIDHLQCQNYVLDVLRSCWAENPPSRPDLRHCRQKLKQLSAGILKRNLMDHMMAMMEKYQNDLETLVDERTAELKDEKKRTELLLHRMLPKSVAEQLLTGQDVAAEMYNSVTIYFSDIVGFTNISAESTPIEIVNFLNGLYTLFDRILRQYDVYKVETIGDAYMVVSGLPIRNGDRHAGEIATMALHLREAIRSFEIPHLRDRPLLLRIGLHTGPCCAGVVGKTMPRYCLFGDTVNTASRMESNGEAMKIHTSEETRNLLEHINGYVLVERGVIAVKGKGDMRTYWLEGKESGISMNADEEQYDDQHTDLFPINKFQRPVNLRARPSFKTMASANRGSTSSLLQLDKRRAAFSYLSETSEAGNLTVSAILSSQNSSFTSTTRTSYRLLGHIPPTPVTPGITLGTRFNAFSTQDTNVARVARHATTELPVISESIDSGLSDEAVLNERSQRAANAKKMPRVSSAHSISSTERKRSDRRYRRRPHTAELITARVQSGAPTQLLKPTTLANSVSSNVIMPPRKSGNRMRKRSVSLPEANLGITFVGLSTEPSVNSTSGSTLNNDSQNNLLLLTSTPSCDGTMLQQRRSAQLADSAERARTVLPTEKARSENDALFPSSSVVDNNNATTLQTRYSTSDLAKILEQLAQYDSLQLASALQQSSRKRRKTSLDVAGNKRSSIKTRRRLTLPNIKLPLNLFPNASRRSSTNSDSENKNRRLSDLEIRALAKVQPIEPTLRKQRMSYGGRNVSTSGTSSNYNSTSATASDSDSGAKHSTVSSPLLTGFDPRSVANRKWHFKMRRQRKSAQSLQSADLKQLSDFNDNSVAAAMLDNVSCRSETTGAAVGAAGARTQRKLTADLGALSTSSTKGGAVRLIARRQSMQNRPQGSSSRHLSDGHFNVSHTGSENESQ